MDDGRGWFRTSDLSRVKRRIPRSVLRPLESAFPWKLATILARQAVASQAQMGIAWRTRIGAGLCGSLALLIWVVPAAGEPASQPSRHRVHAATTGNNSELVSTIPIARHRGHKSRVVMSLRPGRLPPLRRGDRLRVSAEVQVTTTCVVRGPRCIGRPYRFTPTVDAKLLLTSGRNRTGGRGTARIGRERSMSCDQRRPNRNHHCVLVPRGTRAVAPRRMPCRPRDCRLNLVVNAYDGEARRGNVLVIGADRPDGSIDQDFGRLNALVVPKRPDPRPVHRHTHRRWHRSIPVRPRRPRGKRVVYSVKMPRLSKGDVLAIKARERTAIGQLSYNAYVGSEVILAGSPGATHPSRRAKRVAALRGRITEANGFNCTQGPSAYRTPCLTRKAGLLEVVHDAVDRRGHPKPLFVNLVCHLSPKLAQSPAGDQARVRPSGHLQVTRFSSGG